ncbi:putative Cysteine/Histidine-rich C1 domain family protein [Melia azedarach]|uniref:Cysteine/Histidine-rich C1 domain family protein n=1 Tax=Melia azedarach TaxID=155640 RepID=A0ACC1X2D4_MELAZ|nr:putative Cysteine/Histidine-rich C1 domain family protein [Melia azedarach]
MEFKHFSHPHSLGIYQAIQLSNEHICSGCESIISGSAYGCWDCKFFLHEQCGNANRAMQHQSHPMHHLTLIPSATYSTGNFFCNACGDTGSAFSFCCPLCEFDLHVPCAFLPETVIHQAHVHSLSLGYALPPGQYYELSSYVCDICQKQLDKKRFWSYNCFACNFHAHTSCATAKPEPYSAAQNNKEESQNQPEQTEIEDPVLRTQLELQRLQLEIQMAQELANMMSSFNLSSLV